MLLQEQIDRDFMICLVLELGATFPLSKHRKSFSRISSTN
jgi:hypothetical protein